MTTPRAALTRATSQARSRLAAAVSSTSRGRKSEHLTALVPAGSTVLAIGVSDPGYSSTHNQVEMALAERAQVTGLFYADLQGIANKIPFSLVRGDGCALPFRDKSFDYVISNAVVEHVGDESRQQLFMQESLRVARRAVFHTTPNRWNPVETHTKRLFVHWLPRHLHTRLLTRADYRWAPNDRLISRRELAALVRGADASVTGWPRVWPLTLTLVTHLQAPPGVVRETPMSRQG